MQNDHLTAIWQAVLQDLHATVSKANFITLFQTTVLISFDDGIATVSAPSMMIIDLLQKRFSPAIQASLEKHLGSQVSLLFVPKTPRAQAIHKQGPLFAQEEPAKPLIGHLPRVRPDYTFQNFAVSGSNKLAFVSAQSIVANMGHVYNPFFIYGPVGVGKTHLMHAIANEEYQKAPEKKIIYLTSEEFTNEVVDAIRTNDTARMKKKFRSSQLLMIDDIQFIEGKEKVQEELFHTFNILIDNGAQICLSSDRPPQEIKRLEARLSSRFAGGLTVDIGKPDLELKTAILGIKAQKYNAILPNDVALFLAEQVEDTRSLEGLLLRVITLAATGNEDITLDLAKRAIGQVAKEGREHVHADDVIKSVCDFYRIKSTQLKGPKRDASLVKARQVCMYLLKRDLEMTYADIGNILGGRDHTTVMHGVEKMENLVENKAHVFEDIQGITMLLRG
ncbi:MAG: chromosomal replication initiator protein DnaA [Candidatus Levybacteria bacterium]|nr:chromosomal replication initiator protein DnaA [Candidatus Levybacteria bacterium]